MKYAQSHGNMICFLMERLSKGIKKR